MAVARYCENVRYTLVAHLREPGSNKMWRQRRAWARDFCSDNRVDGIEKELGNAVSPRHDRGASSTVKINR